MGNYRFQWMILIVGIGLFGIKLWAWYISHSVAILTDALESIVNIVAAFLGLYTLWISSRPKDKNHPYGHGKAEFISATFEGILIVLAGIYICYKSIFHFFYGNPIKELGLGVLLISASGFINYCLGFFAIKRSKKYGSPALEATGKHLQSDTYSTLGILLGLLFYWIFKKPWIDSLVAGIFGIIILYQGSKIIKSSLAGIMDEADTQLLNELIAALNNSRKNDWIDIHNLRIIKYGSILHMDCHLTVPWYYNVHQAHKVVDELQELVNQHFAQKIELFVHTDGCLPISCSICGIQECTERTFAYQSKLVWNISNITDNEKHTYPT